MSLQKMKSYFFLYLLALTLVGCASSGKKSESTQSFPAPASTRAASDRAIPHVEPIVSVLPRSSPMVTKEIPDVSCKTPETMDKFFQSNALGSNYIACQVDGLERYSGGRLSVYSMWRGAQCVDGKAYGAGYALWCSTGERCTETSENVRLKAVGVANKGSLSDCPVRFATHSTVFTGRVLPNGEIDQGLLTTYRVQNGSNSITQKFGGKFRTGNNYDSGAIDYGGRKIINGSFQNNLPNGASLVIESDGNIYNADCNGIVCTKIDRTLLLGTDERQLIERAFGNGVISGAEARALERAILKLFPRLSGGPISFALSFFIDSILPRVA